jgi:serine protease AprX
MALPLPARSWVRITAVAAFALLTMAGAHPEAREERKSAQLKKLDRSLQTDVLQHKSGRRRVLIRSRPADRAALTALLAAHGARVLGEVRGNTWSVDVPSSALAALMADPSVLRISSDAIVRTRADLAGMADTGADASLVAAAPSIVRATLGIEKSAGKRVVVAVVDSGIEPSSEFEKRVVAAYDFTNGKATAGTAADEYGHGTHVAGTIAGSGALGKKDEYRGVAAEVKLVVLKVLDATGAGYTSDVLRAIDFAVANRHRFGIDIINLSLGHPIYESATTDPLVQAVERASRAGLIVVIAAGNMGVSEATGLPGYAGITSPGNAPSAITVGAVTTSGTASRHDDRIPAYSSAGPTWYDAFAKPDILAPGHRVISVAAKRGTLYKTQPQLRAVDTDYMRLSGTSMATAVTSGVVALMIDAHRDQSEGDANAPPLTPNLVKAMLQYSAIPVHDHAGGAYDPLRAGAGSINAAGAIALSRAVDTTARPGGYWLNPQPAPWTMIAGTPTAWSQAILWGEAVIWGSTLSVNHTAWSSAVIWGSTDVWSNAVIWGSNVVWTDPQSWGSAVIWGSGSFGKSDGTAVIWGSTGGITADNTAGK